MAKVIEKEEAQKLSDQQMAFVCAYLQTFNATKAAKQAGYSKDTAYSQGGRLLNHVEVKAEISKRLKTEGITPERIIIAWSEIAFDNDMADFEDAVKSGKSLKDLKAEGYNTKLIKSLSIGKQGVKVEMYSRPDALDKITKIAGMYIDKIEHSGRVDSLITQEKFEDMNDERRARLFRTAGLASIPGEGDGADKGSLDDSGE